jgi:leucyl/phenylalanyl-tRNA--protein transferase
MTRRTTTRASTSSGPFAAIEFAPGADLVAAGGELEPALVVDGYRHGVFPWYVLGDPVLWWSPDPRGVLPLDGLHVPRRLARRMRRLDYEVRTDVAFEAVMRACDERRPDGSWIHEDMVRCFAAMHRAGDAHSLEVYDEHGVLIGGIYGVAFGGCFAAESMFHRAKDASKIALVSLVDHLRERGFVLLDVQFKTPHLARFGCVEIPRSEYLERLAAAVGLDVTW